MTGPITEDGLTLETAWSGPPSDGAGLVVLCHPHPQQDGTMDAPLMRSLANRLADRGLRVLRFNFRGVGDSEGGWSGGDGEVRDVAAAVAFSREAQPDLPFGLAGWSFGAVTALRWQAQAGDDSPYVGVAPALAFDPSLRMPESDELPPARRLFILGDRDQFCSVDELATYADGIGAELEILPGSDHFFVFRDVAVGNRMADFFAGLDTSGQ
ncbi:MAG TPA: alpha/beta fold hydrolase [Acidimicrobiia bacterium]|nr:alpha/beta fold hydrolase [Acidimicrobiia bacterium]